MNNAELLNAPFWHLIKHMAISATPIDIRLQQLHV